MLREVRRIRAFDGARVDSVVFAGAREVIARSQAGIARWSLDADEEEQLHVTMLRGAAARGHREIVFKPHPTAPERWSRLLEIYIPVREVGSDRIMGVAEFYLPPREIDRQVADARLMAWAVVSLVIIVSAALLFGIVKQGSDTIVRQEAALTRQVGELTSLVDHNATLSERVRTAAERTTTCSSARVGSLEMASTAASARP